MKLKQLKGGRLEKGQSITVEKVWSEEQLAAGAVVEA